MIVCHCNVLTSKHIREAVEAASGRDGLSLVTPGAVFKENEKRPRCGCCMSHIHKLIEEHMGVAAQAEDQSSARTIVQNRTATAEAEAGEPEKNGDLTPESVWNNSKL